MILDLDIYRTANLLVKRHGPDAPIHAAMRADAMLDKGDLDGYAVWKRAVRTTPFSPRTRTSVVLIDLPSVSPLITELAEQHWDKIEAEAPADGAPADSADRWTTLIIAKAAG